MPCAERTPDRLQGIVNMDIIGMDYSKDSGAPKIGPRQRAILRAILLDREKVRKAWPTASSGN
jgi:hypothetical protein